VDELVSTDEVTAAGVTIPAHLVAAVAEVPYGAHPSSCYPRYGYDRAHLREYVSAAQSGQDDLEKYLGVYLGASEQDYRAAVGAERLAALATWSESTAAWQELFS
jgi:glutaconate CoA-transferase, subunit A